MSQAPHPDLNASKPWLAECEVGPGLAIKLIEAQFPALAPVTLSHLGTGWDNVVYLVRAHDQQLVFRFPRRSMALELMDTEWKLLDQLAPRLPLTIPRPLYAGVESPDYKWPFAGYSLVPGQTACQADLNTQARIAAAAPLGRMLSVLHAQDLDWAQSLNLPGDRLAKVDIVQRLPQTTSRLAQAVAYGLIQDPAPLQALIDSLPETTPAERPVQLVHGDLYVRHLVVDKQHRLTGVIDWGDAHLGDRATDLSIVYSFLPPAARPAFWQAYGEVDAMTRLLARFRALFHSLALLLYGHDTADQDLLRESSLSLGWLHLEPA